MKTLNFTFLLAILLFVSCSKEEPTEFSGNYTGEIVCTGGVDIEDNWEGEIFIIKNLDGSYSIEFDEATFQGTAEDNTLTIPSQLAEPNSSDETLVEFTIVENDNGEFIMSLNIKSDGEESNCASTLTKN